MEFEGPRESDEGMWPICPNSRRFPKTAERDAKGQGRQFDSDGGRGRGGSRGSWSRQGNKQHSEGALLARSPALRNCYSRSAATSSRIERGFRRSSCLRRPPVPGWRNYCGCTRSRVELYSSSTIAPLAPVPHDQFDAIAFNRGIYVEAVETARVDASGTPRTANPRSLRLSD